MKKVYISKCIATGVEKVKYIPNGVFSEVVTDYRDNKTYLKYYYKDNKGNKIECEISYI